MNGRKTKVVTDTKDKFFCYGTYSKNFYRCLVTCMFKEECEEYTKIKKMIEGMEKEVNEIEKQKN